MPRVPPPRPRAPIRIVEAGRVVNLDDLRTEYWTLSTLLPEIADTRSCIEWLAARGLIANSRTCEVGGEPMSFNVREAAPEGYEWQCREHGKKTSLRAGSWFENSKLTMKQIVEIVYWWSIDVPQKTIGREVYVSENTVVDWMNFIRDVCHEDIQRHPEPLGGVHEETGEPIIVEIDETKYFHRKYHRGQWREGHWVFGGIERMSGKCFLVEVENRRAVTLLPLIQEHILPGSYIMSDGWRAYHDLNHDGVYLHDVVIHERHFVNADHPEFHTQNIENMWMRAKKKLKRQCGTSDVLFPTYLGEFMWLQRTRHREAHRFALILSCIREQYQF